MKILYLIFLPLLALAFGSGVVISIHYVWHGENYYSDFVGMRRVVIWLCCFPHLSPSQQRKVGRSMVLPFVYFIPLLIGSSSSEQMTPSLCCR